MKPIEHVTRAELLAALKKTRRPSASIPSAAPAERTGLSALMRRGWSLESPDCVQYRLYRPGQDTGLCVDERTACEAARRLERLSDG